VTRDHWVIKVSKDQEDPKEVVDQLVRKVTKVILHKDPKEFLERL
jgi:hypothetical protein